VWFFQIACARTAENNRQICQVTIKLIDKMTTFPIDKRSNQKISGFAMAYMAMS